MIISSQRYLSQDIVAEKIANQDFEVQVSPEFEIDGEIYIAILDGHHSFEAARQAGVQPVFCEQDETDNDTICLLNHGEIDAFLENQVDSYWYNAETGIDVW